MTRRAKPSVSSVVSVAPAAPAADVVQRYWVPRSVLDRSWSLLRQDGHKQVESTVLWGGRRFGSDAVVMAVLYPCGPDVARSRGHVQVGSDTTAEMGRWLRAQSLSALMQVHTHPGRWTGHSQVDDEFSIASSEGFLSLVWPEYARAPLQAITDCGIHRLHGGRWHAVTGTDATSLIRVVEDEAMIWASPPEPPRGMDDAAAARGGSHGEW